jgi:hypothetical protein
MGFFERAQALSPTGSPDAILRWNACVRFLSALAPEVESSAQHLGDGPYG